jgi:predicted dehydrogenase
MIDDAKTTNEGDEQPYVVGFISSANPHVGGLMLLLDALPQVKAIHLCGIEDADIEKQSSRSSKVTTTTRNIDELLARDDLDAVVVCVRNDWYPDALEAAVAAGVPALFEKPGALRAPDLRRVADHARERGLTMGASMPMRRRPQVQEVLRARQAGALGRIMSAEGRFVAGHRNSSHWLFGRDTAGSGFLGWLGVHIIDLLHYLVGERVVEVMAMVDNLHPIKIEVEDTACLVFRFAGGTLGTLHSGYVMAPGSGGGKGMYLALRGVLGSAELPLGEEGNRYTMSSVAPGWVTAGRREGSFEPPPSQAPAGAPGEQLMAEFLRAARAGTPAPCPIEEAVHTLEIIDATLESSATRRAVRIDAPVAVTR